VTQLVLAWGSPEYIGRGMYLQLTTQDTPGENRISLVNANVTATLTSSTRIDGVPELVSELRITGADQSSVITCASKTNGTSVTTMFVNSGTCTMYTVLLITINRSLKVPTYTGYDITVQIGRAIGPI
jgi:hypothetical protein